MNLLDVQDGIVAGSYRSDRAAAVPFTTLQDVLAEGQAIMEAFTPGEPWAGYVSPSCVSRVGAFVVNHEIGVGLRIGGEANLCFQCGPEGGHYHPSVSMDEARAAASRLAHR